MQSYPPRMRSVSLSLSDEVSQFPQASEEAFSLSSSDVRGTLWFLSQVEWTPKGPESKQGPISLQWRKFRLVFHLTR